MLTRSMLLGILCFAAATVAARAEPPAQPPLDFSTPETGRDDPFARSVTARYAGDPGRGAIVADLREQGFDCEADGSSCTRVVMAGSCADVWSVDIPAHGAASGHHDVRCMGAMEEDD